MLQIVTSQRSPTFWRILMISPILWSWVLDKPDNLVYFAFAIQFLFCCFSYSEIIRLLLEPINLNYKFSGKCIRKQIKDLWCSLCSESNILACSSRHTECWHNIDFDIEESLLRRLGSSLMKELFKQLMISGLSSHAIFDFKKLGREMKIFEYCKGKSVTAIWTVSIDYFWKTLDFENLKIVQLIITDNWMDKVRERCYNFPKFRFHVAQYFLLNPL